MLTNQYFSQGQRVQKIDTGLQGVIIDYVVCFGEQFLKIHYDAALYSEIVLPEEIIPLPITHFLGLNTKEEV